MKINMRKNINTILAFPVSQQAQPKFHPFAYANFPHPLTPPARVHRDGAQLASTSSSPNLALPLKI